MVPPLVGLYYGILDIWGDEWEIIKNHKNTHEIIFSILASLTIIILFIKGISEQFKGIVQKKYQNLLESLVVFLTI